MLTVIQPQAICDVMNRDVEFGPMTLRRHAILCAAVLVLVTPVAGYAGFKAPQGAEVNPVNNTVFEVVSRGAGSGPIYWCAAADYARRALGASWQTKVYIARGRGVSETTGKRSSVQFTLDAGAVGVTPSTSWLSTNSLAAGENMSVQQANTYCNIPPSRF